MTDREIPLPLCVDLDGTLLATDSLHELAIRLALQRPADLLRLPLWLARGRAHMKARMAERVRLDPATLAYRPEVVALVREASAAGRPTILVTAADRRTAEAVAAHVGGFGEVMASDGAENLKGSRKAAALAERFGRGGFEYLGDARADLPVWEAAGGVSLVAASPRLARRVFPHLPVRRRLDAEPVPAARRARAWARALVGPGALLDLFVLVPFAAAWIAGAPGAGVPRRAAAAWLAFVLAGGALSLMAGLRARTEVPSRDPAAPSLAGAAAAATALSAASLAVWLAFLPVPGLAVLLAHLAVGGIGALAPPASRAWRAAGVGLGVALRVAAGSLALG